MQNEITQVIFGGQNGAQISVSNPLTGAQIQVGDATVFNSGPVLSSYFGSPSVQQNIQQSGLAYIVMSHSDSVNSSDLPNSIAQMTQTAPVPTVFFNPGNVTVITPGVQPQPDPSRSSYQGAYPVLSSSPGIEVIPTPIFIKAVTGGGG
jgi:hypothetical protein